MQGMLRSSTHPQSHRVARKNNYTDNVNDEEVLLQVSPPLMIRYGWIRAPLAIWRCGWRKCCKAGPSNKRACPCLALSIREGVDVRLGMKGAVGGGTTTTASATSRVEGTRRNLGVDDDLVGGKEGFGCEWVFVYDE